MKLIQNPYSLDECKLEFDKNGYGHAKAKIMKVGQLKYVDQNGKIFFADISLDELEKVKNTAVPIDITIRHPSDLLSPEDVQKNSHGTTLGKPEIQEIDGEQWLVDGVILKTKASIKVAESDQLGTSAGYWRDAVKVNEGNVKFEDIVPNHLAIGCFSPRAKGAELFSLDSSDSEHGRIFELDKQQSQKKEVRMKRTLNAVKGQGYSLDEALIDYADESDKVVEEMVMRQKALIGQFDTELDKQKKSFDEKVEAIEKEKSTLKGANTVLAEEKETLEKNMEKMISMDEVEKRISDMAEVKNVLKSLYGKEEVPEFKSPIDGVKLALEKKHPGTSFDNDDAMWGAFTIMKGNSKDNAEMQKSREALANRDQHSMDDKQKVSLSQISIDALRKAKEIRKRKEA